jgi:hypothetical protein
VGQLVRDGGADLRGVAARAHDDLVVEQQRAEGPREGVVVRHPCALAPRQALDTPTAALGPDVLGDGVERVDVARRGNGELGKGGGGDRVHASTLRHRPKWCRAPHPQTVNRCALELQRNRRGL